MILTLITIFTLASPCLARPSLQLFKNEFETTTNELGGCSSTQFGCCDDNSTQCFSYDCSDCPKDLILKNSTNHKVSNFTNMSGLGFISGYGAFSNISGMGYFFNLTGIGNVTTQNHNITSYYNFTNLTGIFRVSGHARLQNITGFGYFSNITDIGNLSEWGSFDNITSLF